MRTPALCALLAGLPSDGHRVSAGEASRGCAHVRRRARRAARLRRVHRVPGIVHGRAPRVRRVEPAGEPVQGHSGGGGEVGGAAHRRARRRRRGLAHPRGWGGRAREVRGAARQGERAAGAVRGVRPRRVQGVSRAPALRRSASRRGKSRRSRRRRHGPGPRAGSRDNEGGIPRVHGARGAGHALARGFVPHGDPAGKTRRRRERRRRRREDAPVCPPRAGVPGSGVCARGEANADLPQVPRVSAPAPRAGGGGHAGRDEGFRSVARESRGAQVLPGVFLPPLVHARYTRDGGAEGRDVRSTVRRADRGAVAREGHARGILEGRRNGERGGGGDSSSMPRRRRRAAAAEARPTRKPGRRLRRRSTRPVRRREGHSRRGRQGGAARVRPRSQRVRPVRALRRAGMDAGGSGGALAPSERAEPGQGHGAKDVFGV
mmetsp:Transcript_11900/g.47807  ORF Transcript_11900/g.47807 Transcript_11900/m.47807 type:complete len:433 (-) Transcript_11900:153-1451(-)